MSNNTRRIDPTIIAALIGVLGTLCVTVISLLANNFISRPQSPQPTVPVQPTWTIPPTVTVTNTAVPTDTSAPGEPTSTPAPDTPTPEPTLTPVPPAIGADWQNDCISILWRTYPELALPTLGNGCLAQPILFPEQVNLIFTENDSLKFSVNRAYENPQVFGLFAPINLPANGTVRIDTIVTRLPEGEVWMGVFAEPNITSQGLVAVLPSGENVRNLPLVQRKMPELVEIGRLENFAEDSSQDPPHYSIIFEINNGTVRIQSLGKTEFNPVPLNSPQLWVFIGYQVVSGNNRLDAEFLNLLVQGQ
jgi:hypothetical protein